MKMDFVEDEQLKQSSKTPYQSKSSKKTLTEKRKSELIEEIGKLLECLGYGHKHFVKFPELNIKDSSEIKPRIYRNIYLLMK